MLSNGFKTGLQMELHVYLMNPKNPITHEIFALLFGFKFHFAIAISENKNCTIFINHCETYTRVCARPNSIKTIEISHDGNSRVANLSIRKCG